MHLRLQCSNSSEILQSVEEMIRSPILAGKAADGFMFALCGTDTTLLMTNQLDTTLTRLRFYYAVFTCVQTQ